MTSMSITRHVLNTVEHSKYLFVLWIDGRFKCIFHVCFVPKRIILQNVTHKNANLPTE